MLRFLRQQTMHWLLLLGVSELLLLIASFNASMYVRYFRNPDELAEFSRHMPERSLVFAVMIMLGMAAMGQYQAHMRASWFGMMARQAVAFILGGLGLVVGYYVVPQAYVGRGVLAIALPLAFLALIGLRLVFVRLVEIGSFKRRILILGAGQQAAHIHHLMRRRSDRRGFNVVGYVSRPNEAVAVPAEHVFSPDIPLRVLVARERVDEIVVGVDDRRGGLPMEDLLECRQLGLPIIDLTTFFERESGRVQLSMLDPSWLIFSAGFDATPVRRMSKRSFDLIAAIVMLVVGWPLMLGVVLAIRLESGPGQPILYRQERVGERGQTFKLLKFRSMRTDAELDGVARWAGKNDNRVTRVGRICRKLRFDELPQLWNVLKGEMSIVGPRPERPEFVSDLAIKIRYYSLRHCLKPGLAGWAQLSYPYGASEEDAMEKLKYDLYYVKNHNLMLDLLILIQTVEVVIFRRGAR